MGMGGAFTAVADDVNAIFYNPAGLDYIGQSDLSFGYDQRSGNGRSFNMNDIRLVQPLGNLGTIGIVYGQRDIDLLLLSPGAQNWAGYLYKTGLFYDEYVNGIKPWGFWAGIDCSGLVQRCANAAGYTRVPILSDATYSEPYHVEGTMINTFNDPQYSSTVTSSSNLDFDLIEVGDIIHFSANLALDRPQHYAIVYQKGYSLSELLVIHTNGGGLDAWHHKVKMSQLSEFGGRAFNIHRLKP